MFSAFVSRYLFTSYNIYDGHVLCVPGVSYYIAYSNKKHWKCSVSDLGFFFIQTAFIVQRRNQHEIQIAVYGWKPSWEKMDTNIVARRKKPGVLSNRCQTGWSSKTIAVDNRNIVRTAKTEPKLTVSYISNNLKRGRVKVWASKSMWQKCMDLWDND